jgi:hypothetical protein
VNIFIQYHNYLPGAESKKILLLILLMVVSVKIIRAQTTPKVTYLVIFEDKNDINFLAKNSTINAGNMFKINDFNSMSQLYPVVKFEDSLSNKINSIFQVEGDFKNNNQNFNMAQFSFMELYGQLSSGGKHYFTFGKKRLDWGSGLIWNPTVFYTQKDPLRVQNRLEGIFMLNYSYVSEKSTLGVYVFPDSTFKQSKVTVKYDFTGNRVDGSLSYLNYGLNNHQLGYSISYGGDRFTLYSEGVVRNFTKSYNIGSDGIILTPTKMKRRVIPEIVFGSSIILSPKVTYFLEYRYKDDNLNADQVNYYEANPAVNALLYDPISVGKHTIFNNIAYTDGDGRWSLSLRNFYDPVSKQLIVSPLYTYKIKNFQIELSTTVYNNALAVLKSQSTFLLSFTY